MNNNRFNHAAENIASHIGRTLDAVLYYDYCHQRQSDYAYYLNISPRAVVKLYENKIREIHKYTREDPNLIVERMKNYQGEACELWPQFNDPLQFHAGTPRQIYSWLGIVDYMAVLRELIIKRIKAQRSRARILDFAAGNGEVVIRLAEEGYNVTYADIGLKARDFVRWRCKKRKLKVTFAPIENGEVCLGGKFDYIICLNALSHFPDAKTYLDRFYSWLDDGGEIYIGDDIKEGGNCDNRPPWHLKQNIQYASADGQSYLYQDWEMIDVVYIHCNAWRKKGGNRGRIFEGLP